MRQKIRRILIDAQATNDPYQSKASYSSNPVPSSHVERIIARIQEEIQKVQHGHSHQQYQEGLKETQGILGTWVRLALRFEHSASQQNAEAIVYWSKVGGKIKIEEKHPRFDKSTQRQCRLAIGEWYRKTTQFDDLSNRTIQHHIHTARTAFIIFGTWCDDDIRKIQNVSPRDLRDIPEIDAIKHFGSRSQ